MEAEALCVACGCTDLSACPEGCSWLYVDRDIGYGICNSCPEDMARFEALCDGLHVVDEALPEEAAFLLAERMNER